MQTCVNSVVFLLAPEPVQLYSTGLHCNVRSLRLTQGGLCHSQNNITYASEQLPLLPEHRWNHMALLPVTTSVCECMWACLWWPPSFNGPELHLRTSRSLPLQMWQKSWTIFSTLCLQPRWPAKAWQCNIPHHKHFLALVAPTLDSGFGLWSLLPGV